ncbi:MAG: hypothetical protein JNK63_09160 [Chthonomonas sp.]|nr:hypothetical protein [Chthonomonas sp.]
MASESRKEIDVPLLVTWVATVVVGIWLKAHLQGLWPDTMIGQTDSSDESSFNRNLALPILASSLPPLLVLLLQGGVLLWRFARFPVIVWTALGFIVSISAQSAGILVFNVVMAITGKSIPDQGMWTFGLGMLITGLLCVLIQSFFLASIFKRAEVWLYIGAAYYGLWFTFVILIRAFELPLPQMLVTWLIPLLGAVAQGYWLAAEDLAEEPHPVVARS